MSLTFKPAVREQVSLLVALAGASGSGKTMSALRLAQGMAPSGKIAFIDTEARRGLHYADRFDFMHADMRPPFTPEAFIQGIHAAEASGAEVVIIDSFSHEYDGEGGIMDEADALADGTPKPGIEHPRAPNSGDHDWWKDWLIKPVPQPGNWKEPKRAHKKMMNALLQCRASLIFCLRADEKIQIVKDDRGRTQVLPLGWMPICEKRFMFEMTASFMLVPDQPGRPFFNAPHKLQEQHRPFFHEGEFIDENAGRKLAEWARGDVTKTGTPAPNPLFDEGCDAAAHGTEILRAFWSRLKQAQKRSVGGAPQLEKWKEIAKRADDEAPEDDFDQIGTDEQVTEAA